MADICGGGDSGRPPEDGDSECGVCVEWIIDPGVCDAAVSYGACELECTCQPKISSQGIAPSVEVDSSVSLLPAYRI